MELKDLVVKTMEDKKGLNVAVIDFKNTSPLTDYVVICDAPSMRQVSAIADDVEKAIIEAGFEIRYPVKRSDSGWILIDAGDVIAHIFQSEERSHYNLEKLYKDYID
jgi:ribosome-associated protein